MHTVLTCAGPPSSTDDILVGLEPLTVRPNPHSPLRMFSTRGTDHLLSAEKTGSGPYTENTIYAK